MSGKKIGNNLGMKKVKKILLYCCVVICAVGGLYSLPKKPTLFLRGEAEVFYNYAVQTDFEWVDVGFGRLVYCHSTEVGRLPQDYFAVSLTVEAQDWQRFVGLNTLTVVARENTPNGFAELCFCRELVGGVLVGGKKVNLQVAQSTGQNTVKVGFPLIVGAF